MNKRDLVKKREGVSEQLGRLASNPEILSLHQPFLDIFPCNLSRSEFCVPTSNLSIVACRIRDRLSLELQNHTQYRVSCREQFGTQRTRGWWKIWATMHPKLQVSAASPLLSFPWKENSLNFYSMLLLLRYCSTPPLVGVKVEET